VKVALLLTLALCGCASRKVVTGPTLLLDANTPGCITSVAITNCVDLKSDPPKCLGPSKIIYKKGCEKVLVLVQ
jgi:type IV pilus biogenesis protein CpaD/CtpE